MEDSQSYELSYFVITYIDVGSIAGYGIRSEMRKAHDKKLHEIAEAPPISEDKQAVLEMAQKLAYGSVTPDFLCGAVDYECTIASMEE